MKRLTQNPLTFSALGVVLSMQWVLAEQVAGQENRAIIAALVPELTSAEPAILPAGIVPGEGTGIRFEDDFDADGRREIFLLGHFADDEMQRSFVLIASQLPGGELERVDFFRFDEETILGKRDASRPGIAIFFCNKCDYGGRIEWTGSDFEFSYFPAPGVAQ